MSRKNNLRSSYLRMEKITIIVMMMMKIAKRGKIEVY